MIRAVVVTKRAQKDLASVPEYVAQKFADWVRFVALVGLEEARKVPGYHDEPLKGERKGQRSIRLSKAYRAIYEIQGTETRFVSVEEVNKHRY